MEHNIQTTLGTERLDVFIDGEPHSLLCRYPTDKGSIYSVYTKDNSSRVVIEQDTDAAIMGLFSTEDNKIRDLFDYIAATISRKQAFDYCLTSDMQKYLSRAIALGGDYKFLSNKIMPEKHSLFAHIIPRFYKQPALETSLALKVLNHLVSVEHLERVPQHQESVPDMDSARSSIEITPYSYTQISGFRPAKALPKGWYWREHRDGTGALQAPDGHFHFFYDRHSVSSGHFSYLEDAASPWQTFDGSLDDFKAHAESMIHTKYLQRKKPLENTIQSADSRKPARSLILDTKAKDTELEL